MEALTESQHDNNRLPLGNLIEPIATSLDEIDLERVVWDQEYREQVRHLLSGGVYGGTGRSGR